MAAYSSVLPPSSLNDVLQPVGEMSSSQFKELLSAVSGPRSFSLSKDEVEALRNKIAPYGANATFLIAALSFLYSHISRLLDAGMPYGKIIDETVEELDREAKWGEKKGDVKDRFAQLFDPQVHQLARKLQRLQAGFVPSAIGFSTFVDLRPVFGEGSEIDINGYLPIIQFRVTTDSNVAAEKQIVFQLSESAAVEFRKALDRMDEKLALLKTQSAISSQIKKL